MKIARGLILASAGLFCAIGLGYLLAPGLMLSIVGIPSAPTEDFLMRTEGVALITGGGLLFAARNGSPSEVRVVLFVLGVYYVLGSLVDVVAFAQGVVGTASVPSAAIRIVVGAVCLLLAARASGEERSSGV